MEVNKQIDVDTTCIYNIIHYNNTITTIKDLI